MIHFQINPVAYIQDISNRSYADLFLDPLHYALTLEQKKATQMQIATTLLENQMPVDKADCHGMTLLMWASENDHPEMMQMLLENGADPELADKNGQTALIKAAHKYSLPAVKILLERKVDTEKVDNTNNTAFAYAMNWRSYETEIIKEFLKHRANTEVRMRIINEPDCSPLEYAIRTKRDQLANSLISYQRKLKGSTNSETGVERFAAEFALAFEENRYNVVRHFLRHKPALITQHEDYLYKTVERGSPYATLYLLQYLSPELREKLFAYRDQKGMSALEKAFHNDDYCNATSLLENGDDITKMKSAENSATLRTRMAQHKKWVNMLKKNEVKIKNDEAMNNIPSSIPMLTELAVENVYQQTQEHKVPIKNLPLPKELIELCEAVPKTLLLRRKNIELQERKVALQERKAFLTQEIDAYDKKQPATKRRRRA